MYRIVEMDERTRDFIYQEVDERTGEIIGDRRPGYSLNTAIGLRLEAGDYIEVDIKAPRSQGHYTKLDPPVFPEEPAEEKSTFDPLWIFRNEIEIHDVNKWIYIALALFGSMLGLHYFYARHYLRGILLIFFTIVGGSAVSIVTGVSLALMLYIWYPTDAFGNAEVY